MYILPRACKVARRKLTLQGRLRVRLGARALLGGSICVALLAGCGAASENAGSVLRRAVVADRSVHSGRLDLALALRSPANSALGGPLALSLTGPFENGAAGALPRFALAATLTTEGATIPLGATSTGSAFYLKFGSEYFVMPQASFAALQSAYAHAAAGSGGSALAPFGVQPLQWLSAPEVVGSETLEGVPVTHIRAHLQVDRLLEAIGRVSSLSSSLRALAGGHLPALAALLEAISSPAGRSALARALKSSQVDVRVGREDHILRALELAVSLQAGGAESAALAGLKEATLSVHLRLAQVNERQTISAPAHALPLSELLGALTHSGLSG